MKRTPNSGVQVKTEAQLAICTECGGIDHCKVHNVDGIERLMCGRCMTSYRNKLRYRRNKS